MLSRLPVNFSSLWDYPNDQFIVRFSDLNEFRQLRLAERIKNTARQAKIRTNPEVTIQQIFECLKEINPVIFHEGSQGHTGWKAYRQWNKNSCEQLSGWNFKTVCETIYLMLCVRRPMKRNEVWYAGLTTIATGGHTLETLLNQHFGSERNHFEQPIPINREEVSLNEVAEARNRAERNGATRESTPPNFSYSYRN